MTTFLFLSVVLGAGLFFLGIWMVYRIQLKEEVPPGSGIYTQFFYKRKVIVAMALATSLGGFFGIWATAANNITVVNSTSVEILNSSPGKMTVELSIHKQRGCKLSSLTVHSVRHAGSSDVSFPESPTILKETSEGYSPDFVVVEINRDDSFTIKSVDFSAAYDCPFGFQISSKIASLVPDPSFNSVLLPAP